MFAFNRSAVAVLRWTSDLAHAVISLALVVYMYSQIAPKWKESADLLQMAVSQAQVGIQDLDRPQAACQMQGEIHAREGLPRAALARRDADARDRDRKSTRLNSSHTDISRMPSSA